MLLLKAHGLARRTRASSGEFLQTALRPRSSCISTTSLNTRTLRMLTALITWPQAKDQWLETTKRVAVELQIKGFYGLPNQQTSFKPLSSI